MGGNDRVIGIVIADDHPVLREGLKMLLSSDPEFKVIGESADGVALLELVDRLEPDVILLDLAMPGKSGLEVLSDLSERGSAARIVVLTAQIQRREVAQALRLGARGIILKESATRLLFSCVRRVMAGEYWVANDGVSDLAEALRRASAPQTAPVLPPIPRLTPREHQIVSLIALGRSNKEISSELGISLQTVKNYLQRIFEKLGVTSRLEVALRAEENSLRSDG